MKKKMQAVTVEKIYNEELYGYYVRFVEQDGVKFYYGRDISEIMSGLTLRTDNLAYGHRVFIKGRDADTDEYLPASQYLDLDALDEVMDSVADEFRTSLAFYRKWEKDILNSQTPTPLTKSMEDFQRYLEKPTESHCKCEGKSAKEAILEARIAELEKSVRALKESSLTKKIDGINLKEDAFDRKWKVAMSMISEYCDNRISVLGTMDQASVSTYRSHLWNDFILVEVDAKLHTTLRREHKVTGKKYKVLIREKGLIDGFFAVVSNLLKFGKG
jgi:hypothetical protein